MPGRDESDLEWYLGERPPIKSSTGPQLEKARLMSPNPARDTHGNALPDKYDRSHVPPEPGLYVEQPHLSVATGAMMQDYDAQPTAEYHSPPVDAEGEFVTPDNDDTRRRSRISTRLARASIEAQHVLRIYYGDQGARWGRTKHGRIFSLYGITKAGAELVRKVEEAEESPVFLPVSERLGVIAELQGIPSQSKRSRKLALDAADRQAWDMYRASCVSWLRTVHA